MNCFSRSEANGTIALPALGTQRRHSLRWPVLEKPEGDFAGKKPPALYNFVYELVWTEVTPKLVVSFYICLCFSLMSMVDTWSMSRYPPISEEIRVSHESRPYEYLWLVWYPHLSPTVSISIGSATAKDPVAGYPVDWIDGYMVWDSRCYQCILTHLCVWSPSSMCDARISQVVFLTFFRCGPARFIQSFVATLCRWCLTTKHAESIIWGSF